MNGLGTLALAVN